MKKGCFLTVIFSLTLLVILSYFLVKFYGEDFLEIGTEHLYKITQTKIEADINNTEHNDYTDSIKVVLGNYFVQIKDLDPQLRLERIEELADNFEIILMDSQIDSAEFDFMIKRLEEHEK